MQSKQARAICQTQSRGSLDMDLGHAHEDQFSVGTWLARLAVDLDASRCRASM